MHDQGRSFLLLQGPCTPFFRRLARQLRQRGHDVTLVDFNGGDQLYRLGLPRHVFQGQPEELSGFLADIWQQHGITDQVLFGDCRPVHRTAILEARYAGIRNHVFEEGYLRPFWITLEREGVNSHSLMPREPGWYRQTARMLPPVPEAQQFRSPFRTRAIHDVAYHLAGLSNPLRFPHYRNHAPVTAPREYAAYLQRFLKLRLQRQRTRDARRIAELRNTSAPYFVLALQLNGDAQIRDHSPFSDMRQVITKVMASFALSAPSHTRLVIKNHPLDMGLMNYAKSIRLLAQRFNLNDRIDYLETGDLNQLLPRAAGLVTVNSTTGFVALEHGCPTHALSEAIYAMPGLTHQGALSSFWQQASPPEAKLFSDFRKTLLHCTQLNGGFYCRQGIDLAVENAVSQLEAQHSPLEKLMTCLPNAA
ncbi:capsule biosynthesis protein [Halomonas mongoliensis]|uniref:capsule biosynthesis protein n=1 Tax=Halomonas mongoliensis TaxID=321265 RepID=UPI00403A99FB